jgi:hypothetical protein
MRGVSMPYDLWFDPNEVGGDFVVECWISHGPRVEDAAFDPYPDAEVSVSDEEDEPLRARVVRRDGDRVWVQLRVTSHTDAVAS